MSYTIYFVKQKNLNLDHVHEILEKANLSPQDEHFISRQELVHLKEKILSIGLETTVFEQPNSDHFALNISIFQVMLYNSSIVLDFPYGIEDTEVEAEIDLVANTILNCGYTGYDPQTSGIYYGERE